MATVPNLFQAWDLLLRMQTRHLGCPPVLPGDLIGDNTPDLDPELWAPLSSCLATSLLGYL